jgi:hypothetical protein
MKIRDKSGLSFILRCLIVFRNCYGKELQPYGILCCANMTYHRCVHQSVSIEYHFSTFFCKIVTVGRDIAARRLTMCGNHGLALQLAYGIAC